MNTTDPSAAIAAMNDLLAAAEEAGPADVLADAVALLREAATLYDAREQPESAGLLRRLARELAPGTDPVPPAADRAALRQQVAKALSDARRPGLGGMSEAEAVAYMADAVLAVLPASVDRAAVLRDAADQYTKLADQNEAYDREQGELTEAARLQHETVRDVAVGLRRMAAETPRAETDATILAELQQHLTDHTPSCNARTDHLMRRAAWALGAPRPAHVGGNAEDCPACEGTNPPYPFICPGPDAAAAQTGCGCPSEDAPEHMFGGENCDCIPFTRQGDTPRYCGPTDTVDMISGWETGSNCPHHKAAAPAQPGKEA